MSEMLESTGANADTHTNLIAPINNDITIYSNFIKNYNKLFVAKTILH